MRFAIKQTSCGSERVGIITAFVKSPGTVLETPTSALLTQGGSVVNLTADVLARVFTTPQLLWVPLANSMHLETGAKAQGEGIAKFAGLPDHFVCSTSNNINDVTPPGHFELNKVPLWTKNGKKMITAERYMEVLEAFKPDLILALADSRTTLSEGLKRIRKSVDRTSNLFDLCVKLRKASKELQHTPLFGVIVGAGLPKQCEESIQNILKHKEDISGVLLAGITDGTEDSLKVSTEVLEDIFKRISESLPKDFLRIVEGSWNPAVVVAAIENGWDMFDGSYPLKLTNAGHALALKFDINSNNDELCILDLNDIRYQEDFRPVLEGCECLACRNHTRAYIRHLLNTREMLSSVLLSIHNLHHFDQLFHHARRHIASNTFQVYRKHITKQYELYRTTQAKEQVKLPSESVSVDFKENSVITQESEPSQIKKKIRVSSDESVANVVN